MALISGETLEAVAALFRIEGRFVDAAPYGSGHINDTFSMVFSEPGSSIRYIFQRINNVVFRDPPALMENVDRVTRHVRGKLAAEGKNDIDRRTLTVIPARDGGSYCLDREGRHWRAYNFIEKARTFDTLEEPDQAFQAARAFGHFQRMLADLPDPPLHETIPGFHDGRARFRAFLEALDADAANRAAEAKREIGFLKAHSQIFDRLPDGVKAGELPIRITHNDCKINNVMMDDATGEGICVIDLDTVMPGLSLYDFGDMVRTCTCPAAEDEQDLDKVTMQFSMFERLVRGYLSSAIDFLTREERSLLAFSGKMITLIIGMRFLTDFLAGDRYFKVKRKGHNLDRCRTQFRLVESILRQEEAMNELVERVAGDCEP